MHQHETMQRAPVVGRLVRGIAECGSERIAGKLGQRLLQAGQQDEIARRSCIRRIRHIEEVDAGRALAAQHREGIEQELEPGVGAIARGQIVAEPIGGQRDIHGVLDGIAAPHEELGRRDGIVFLRRGGRRPRCTTGVETLLQPCRRGQVPRRQARDRFAHGRVVRQLLQRRPRPARGGVTGSGKQVRQQQLRIDRLVVELHRLDVGGGDLVARGHQCREHAVDAAHAIRVVAVVEVIHATARTCHAERIVLQGHADRIIVGVGEVTLGRIDRMRHFRRRHDLVGNRLIGLRMRHRQPVVVRGAGSVADHERRRAEPLAEVLQVVADRIFGAGEIRDVAGGIGVGKVLRAEIEIAQRVLEIAHVLRAVDQLERSQFERRAPAGVGDGQAAGVARSQCLPGQRTAAGRADLYDRPVVPARHDHGDRTIGVTDGIVARDAVGLARRHLVDVETLEHPLHRLLHAVVHDRRGQAVAVDDEGFQERVGHVHRVDRAAPADVAVATLDDARRARHADTRDIEAVAGNQVHLHEDRWQRQGQVRIVGDDRLAGCGVGAADGEFIAAAATQARMQGRCDEGIAGDLVAVGLRQRQRARIDVDVADGCNLLRARLHRRHRGSLGHDRSP